jgi:hypothetical protein
MSDRPRIHSAIVEIGSLPNFARQTRSRPLLGSDNWDAVQRPAVSSRRMSRMRTIVRFAVCISLIFACTRVVVAGAKPEPAATASQPPSAPGDELHFVSVLTLEGEVASIDLANRLVTLRGPKGDTSTLEARNEKDLEPLKAGDHVTIRYFEGAQIAKYKKRDEGPGFSLKHGITAAKLSGPSSKKHAVIATVAKIDTAEQEVTLKGPDGSLETVMVANPAYLEHVKVGDRVGLARAQAMVLSLEKSGD